MNLNNSVIQYHYHREIQKSEVRIAVCEANMHSTRDASQKAKGLKIVDLILM